MLADWVSRARRLLASDVAVPAWSGSEVGCLWNRALWTLSTRLLTWPRCLLDAHKREHSLAVCSCGLSLPDGRVLNCGRLSTRELDGCCARLGAPAAGCRCPRCGTAGCGAATPRSPASTPQTGPTPDTPSPVCLLPGRIAEPASASLVGDVAHIGRSMMCDAIIVVWR